MPEDRKKLDYEVYPHMVEQLVGKIKEQQETAPWAREDFDELISCLKKLAKVGHFTSHVRWCPSMEAWRFFRRHSRHEKDMNKIILSIKSLLKRGLIFQMECKVKLKACQKLHEQKIEVSNLSDRIEMNLWFLDEVISYDSYAYSFQHYWRGSRLKAKTRLQSLGKIRHKRRRLQPTVNGLLMRMTDMLII